MKSNRITILLALFVLLAAGSSLAGEDAKASVAEQMAALEASCAASAETDEARRAESPFYDRLGGYDRIHALTKEIVRLHALNPDIKHLLDGVDYDLLAKHVADFVAAGTGGAEKYTGRDLPSSHAHLHLTDADFLAAGGDIIQAMKNLEYEQQEIDEMVCILVSLKDQVVFE